LRGGTRWHTRGALSQTLFGNRALPLRWRGRRLVPKAARAPHTLDARAEILQKSGARTETKPRDECRRAAPHTAQVAFTRTRQYCAASAAKPLTVAFCSRRTQSRSSRANIRQIRGNFPARPPRVHSRLATQSLREIYFFSKIYADDPRQARETTKIKKL